jgi:serine/threonine protein phosphatase PrpC
VEPDGSLPKALEEVARMRIGGAKAEEIADTLCKRAAEKRHADNTTVIVLFFDWAARDTTTEQQTL